MAPGTAIRRAGDDVLLDIRLTPRAASDHIVGPEQLADGRVILAVRVRAIPEDGKANAAVEALIASALRHPKSAVAVVAGQTSRLKTVRISGAGADAERSLAALMGGSKTDP